MPLGLKPKRLLSFQGNKPVDYALGVVLPIHSHVALNFVRPHRASAAVSWPAPGISDPPSSSSTPPRAPVTGGV